MNAYKIKVIALVAIVAFVNGCGGGKKTGAPTVEPVADNTVPLDFQLSISVNSGAQYTKVLGVVININSQHADQMYVTQTPGCLGGGSWEPILSSKPWTLLNANSNNSLFVKVKKGSQESSCQASSITHDDIAPVLVVSSPTNNSYINSSTMGSVSVTGTCTEEGKAVQFSGDAVVNAQCISGAFNQSFNFSAAGEGNITLNLAHYDAAGNLGNTSLTIIKDTQAPTANTISINSGATHSNTLAVTLGLASTGASHMYITNTAGCSAGGAWEAFAVSKSWNLLNSNASNDIYVKYKDLAENETSCLQASIAHDDIAPTGNSLSINSGAAQTADVNVTLTLASTGAAQMYITNTAGCSSGGNWESFNAAKAWVLPNINSVNNVYVKYKDLAGNESICVNDSIEHDNANPTVAISSPAGGSYVNSSVQASYVVSGTCSENGRQVVVSGDASGSVACAGGLWSANLDFSARPDGNVAINVDHSDAAGNIAPQVSRSFVKDTVAPTGNSIVIAGDAASTNVINVTLTLASSGASEMYVTNISGCSSGGSWEALAASKSWTLGQTNAVATVYAKFRDLAGNESACVNDVITHDNTLPLLTISSPTNGAYVSLANQNSITVNGTCSEEGRNVILSGAASATAACSSGLWSTNLDLHLLSDGAVVINVDHSDAAGNNAIQQSLNLVKDTVPPTINTFAIAGGAQAINTLGTVVNMSSTGAAQMYITEDALCLSGGVWENYSVSKAWSLPNANAVNWIYGKFKDAAGNESACVGDSILHDNVVPTVAISSPVANSYISSANVNSFAVSGACSEDTLNVVISGAASATVSCSSGVWNANLNFTVAGQGNVTINVNHSDLAGNPATQDSRVFIKDTSAPTSNSIAINSGSSATNLTAVTLALGSTGSVEMYVTDDNTCNTGGAWEAYSTSKAWTLSDTNTSVSVYIKYRDAALNESSCISDAIIHDDLPPDWSDGPTHVALFNSLTDSPEVTYGVTANDAGSGTQKYQYAIGTGTTGLTANDIFDWIDVTGGSFTATGMSLTNGSTYYVNMKAIDFAGNEVLLSSTGWTVDNTPPPLAVTSPANNLVMTEKEFKVSGTCEDGYAVDISYGLNVSGSASVACTAGVFYSFVSISGGEGLRSITYSQTDSGSNTTSVVLNVTYSIPLEIAGTVLASLRLSDGSIIYGGTFSGVTQSRQVSLAKLDSSGELSSFDIGAGFNGQINAMTKLSDGSYVVAGDFTRYRGRVATRIAKISSAGVLDEVFNPQSGGNGFGGTIYALASDASAIYVGGSFTAYRGGTNNAMYFAKLDYSGNLTVIPGGNLNGLVRTILIQGANMFVGGDFTTFNGVTVNRVLKMNYADLVVDTAYFGTGFGGNVYSLVSDGTNLYAGGAFTTYKGATARYFCKMSLAGVLDAAFLPSTNTSYGPAGQVNYILLNGADAYVGGTFTRYRNATSNYYVNRFTKVNASTGHPIVGYNTATSSATPIGFNSTVNSIALHNGSIYVGGLFSTYKGVQANRLARINSDGSLDTAYNAHPGINGTAGNINAMLNDGSYLFIGGAFGSVRATQIANNIVKINADGTLDEDFSPQSGANGVNNTVRALAVDAAEENLFIGGDFTTYRGGIANRVAKVSLQSGSVGELNTTFNPSAGGNGTGALVRALAVSSTHVYIGGDFTTYRGTTVNRLARTDTDGVLDTAFVGTGASSGFTTSSSGVYALALSASDLFVGGSFTAYKGVASSANRFAKLSLGGTPGTNDTAFVGTGFGSTVNALIISGNYLYAGGAFTTWKGVSANRLAKIDLVTSPGTQDTAFIGTGMSSTVNTLVSDGTSLFAGGAFTTFKGASARYVAKISQSGGVLDTTFNPSSGANGFSGPNPTVYTLALDGSTLHAGGNFFLYRSYQGFNNVKIDATTGARAP